MDIYQQALAPAFNPDPGNHGIDSDMSMDEYRKHPGIAPSDLKKCMEDIRQKDGSRGHPTKLAADRLRQSYAEQEEEIPCWLREPEKKADHFVEGSLYHTMLMEPHKMESEVAVITEELKEDFIHQARERKREQEAPKKYNGNLTEAREWKKNNPGQEPSDLIKEEILALAQDRKVGEIKFHSGLQEYVDWKEQHDLAGKLVVHADQVEKTERMIDALYSLPSNSEVGEYLETIPKEEDRVENCLFATAQFSSSLDSIQLKGRPDWLVGDGDILDPKTTKSVHPDAFGKDVEFYGYDFSMAGYAVLSELLVDDIRAEEFGFPAKRVGFLAQEKFAPFLARIHWLPDEWLQYAKNRYRAEILRLCKAYSDGQWDTGLMQGGIQTLLPSVWKAKEIEGI